MTSPELPLQPSDNRGGVTPPTDDLRYRINIALVRQVEEGIPATKVSIIPNLRKPDNSRSVDHTFPPFKLRVEVGDMSTPVKPGSDMKTYFTMIDKLEISTLEKFMVKVNLRGFLLFREQEDGISPQVTNITIKPSVPLLGKRITPAFNMERITVVSKGESSTIFGYRIPLIGKRCVFIHL